MPNERPLLRVGDGNAVSGGVNINNTTNIIERSRSTSEYIGQRYLMTQGCIMDYKLLFEDFPEKIIPYDYKAYFSNPDRIVMVTTNCLTGKAEYFEEKSSAERVMSIVRASSSLPFVS